MKWIALLSLFASAVAGATVIPSGEQNAISLDGTWRFKLEQARGQYERGGGERGKIPIEYPEKFESFFATDYKEDGAWHDLAVPGNWEIAGHSPATYNQPDNASGFYRLWFDVPAEWEGRIVKIHFDGVQNGAEIWCNGQPVKVDEPSWGRENYHEGGWTAFQADITPVVKLGARNLLALRVTKNTRSVDCDTGDYFFLGGIHRAVTLFSVPQHHIDDVKVETRLMPNDQAQLKVIVHTAGGDAEHVAMFLEGVDGGADTQKTEKGRTVLTKVLDHPRLWSAEFANLYDLTIELPTGRQRTRVTRRIGIREITIKDGVLLLNNVPIKMAGMCRHDVWAETGTAGTPQLWRKDIEMMKALNINAIRTSHYPYGSAFYDLCDEIGMYVADELPYCWTPTNDAEMTPAFLQRARETVRRDKNHPSVLIWAIGNENAHGKNHQAVADLVKEMDPTRPRCVSRFAFDKYDTELSDSHYTIADEIAKRVANEKTNGHPHIYLENPNDWDVRLAADPGCWEAWGPVLKRPWDVIMREPTLPGTFIWEWQDRAVVDRSPQKLYNFDDRTGINYFKIKGMVDAFRNPRPWTHHIKMIYSPIQVQPALKDMAFEVENRYSFTNLSTLKLKWTLLGAGGRTLGAGVAQSDVPPLSKGRIQIDAPDTTAAKALRVDFDDASGRNVVSHQFTLKEPPPKPLGAWPADVKFPQFNLITRETKGDKQFWRKITRFTAKLIDVKSADDSIDGQIVLENDPSTPVGTVHAERSGNRFTYRVQWTGPRMEVQEIGWVFALRKNFDRFSWHRKSMWTVYPDDHIGRPSGTARPDSADVSLTKITRPDAFDFVSTKADCDWAALTDESGAGLRVQFEPSQRHHCRGGIRDDGYTLTVNRHVSPPSDISTRGVQDLYMTLNKGDVVEGSFHVAAND